MKRKRPQGKPGGRKRSAQGDRVASLHGLRPAIQPLQESVRLHPIDCKHAGPIPKHHVLPALMLLFTGGSQTWLGELPGLLGSRTEVSRESPLNHFIHARTMASHADTVNVSLNAGAWRSPRVSPVEGERFEGGGPEFVEARLPCHAAANGGHAWEAQRAKPSLPLQGRGPARLAFEDRSQFPTGRGGGVQGVHFASPFTSCTMTAPK